MSPRQISSAPLNDFVASSDIGELNQKGVDFEYLGMYNEAIKYFDRVLSIVPNDNVVLYNKGNALANLGKHYDAITYF